jgi:hypothetical protein
VQGVTWSLLQSFFSDNDYSGLVRYATFEQGTDDEMVSADVTISGSPYKAGVFSRASSLQPNDFLLAYRDNTKVYLDAVVDGVTSNLINNSLPVVPGAAIEIWSQGAEASLYYDKSKVGATVETPVLTGTYHGTFDQYGGNTIANLASRAIADVTYPTRPAGVAGRFVWISDVHRNRNPHFTDLAAWFNEIDADFLIDTGDIMIDDLETEYTSYLSDLVSLGVTRYNTPGNHDRGADEAYTLYNSNIGMDHFAVTVGSVRFIGFATKQVAETADTFEVPQAEKDFVAAELAALGGLTPILMSHLKAPDAQFLADAYTAGVRNYLHGHQHANCETYSDVGILFVSGGSADSTHIGNPITQTNTDGGLMVVDVYADRIEITYARARWPWDAFVPSNSGIANDVQYTPIVIPL